MIVLGSTQVSGALRDNHLSPEEPKARKQGNPFSEEVCGPQPSIRQLTCRSRVKEADIFWIVETIIPDEHVYGCTTVTS